jgi:hypothetical protein
MGIRVHLVLGGTVFFVDLDSWYAIITALCFEIQINLLDDDDDDVYI